MSGIGSQVCDVDELFIFLGVGAVLPAALGRFLLTGANRNEPYAVPLGGEFDGQIQRVSPVRGKSLFQRHTLLGGHFCGEWQTAQPVGIERFNDTEVFKDEVSHVPHHQITGKDVLQQIVADGFVLLGAEVEFVIDDVPVEQIEGEIHFAAGGFAVPVAMPREVLRIAFGKADEGGVLDEDAVERTAWRAVGGRAIAPAHVDEAQDEEAFHPAFGAIDSLVQGLGADLLERSVLA